MKTISRWTTIPRSAVRPAAWFGALALALWAGAAMAGPKPAALAEPHYTAWLSASHGNGDFVFPRDGITPQATVPTRKKLLRAKTETPDNFAATSAADESQPPAFESASASPARSTSLLPVAPLRTARSRAPPPTH